MNTQISTTDRPQVVVEFTYSDGKCSPILNDTTYEDLGIEYAVVHRAWRDDEWVDPETGLDVPPPRHRDLWWCDYALRTDRQGVRFAILMPDSMIDYGPPRYISPGRRVLIEQAHRHACLYAAGAR